MGRRLWSILHIIIIPQPFASVYGVLLLQWGEQYFYFWHNWFYSQVETHQRKYLILLLKEFETAKQVSTQHSSFTRMSLRFLPHGLFSRRQLPFPRPHPLQDGRGRYFTRSEVVLWFCNITFHNSNLSETDFSGGGWHGRSHAGDLHLPRLVIMCGGGVGAAHPHTRSGLSDSRKV